MTPNSKIARQLSASSYYSLNDHERALADEVRGQLCAMNAMCVYIGWTDIAQHLALARARLEERLKNKHQS